MLFREQELSLQNVLSLSPVGPSAWNSLPADLRLEPDTAVFKRKLKSYQFRSIFSVFNATRPIVIRYRALFLTARQHSLLCRALS